MKAQRRHELRENDLVHYLKETKNYLDKHGSKIVAGTIVVAVAASVGLWLVRSRSRALGEAYVSMSALTFPDLDQGKQSLDSLTTLTSTTSDHHFLLSALIEQGRAALDLASKGKPAPDREMNEKAKEAFERLLREFKEDPIAVGVAHLGLATAAGNDFVLDGNPAHKETARRHLEQVRDSQLLTGLPFQTFALAQLNNLNETFRPVEFAPPLPKPEVEEEATTEPGSGTGESSAPSAPGAAEEASSGQDAASALPETLPASEPVTEAPEPQAEGSRGAGGSEQAEETGQEKEPEG
ncbi:MAG: hypothetical protein JSV78_08735 [Phycisphaerales bacterium]|nr:MAG: hypothetical protein JSV78_08735 [Phycisphaerales bacterium]